MERKEKKRLVKELVSYINKQKDFNRNFAAPPKNEKNRFRKQYLSKDDEESIDGLRHFLDFNSNLSVEDLNEIIFFNKKKFKLFVKCIEKYPNFYESIKGNIDWFKYQLSSDMHFEELLNDREWI